MLKDVVSGARIKGVQPSFGQKGFPQLSIDHTIVVEPSTQDPEKVEVNRDDK
jgi:hypothetical protein